jgi:hypothetical protein
LKAVLQIAPLKLPLRISFEIGDSSSASFLFFGHLTHACHFTSLDDDHVAVA